MIKQKHVRIYTKKLLIIIHVKNPMEEENRI